MSRSETSETRSIQQLFEPVCEWADGHCQDTATSQAESNDLMQRLLGACGGIEAPIFSADVEVETITQRLRTGSSEEVECVTDDVRSLARDLISSWVEHEDEAAEIRRRTLGHSAWPESKRQRPVLTPRSCARRSLSAGGATPRLKVESHLRQLQKSAPEESGLGDDVDITLRLIAERRKVPSTGVAPQHPANRSTPSKPRVFVDVDNPLSRMEARQQSLRSRSEARRDGRASSCSVGLPASRIQSETASAAEPRGAACGSERNAPTRTGTTESWRGTADSACAGMEPSLEDADVRVNVVPATDGAQPSTCSAGRGVAGEERSRGDTRTETGEVSHRRQRDPSECGGRTAVVNGQGQVDVRGAFSLCIQGGAKVAHTGYPIVASKRLVSRERRPPATSLVEPPTPGVAHSRSGEVAEDRMTSLGPASGLQHERDTHALASREIQRKARQMEVQVRQERERRVAIDEQRQRAVRRLLQALARVERRQQSVATRSVFLKLSSAVQEALAKVRLCIASRRVWVLGRCFAAWRAVSLAAHVERQASLHLEMRLHEQRMATLARTHRSRHMARRTWLQWLMYLRHIRKERAEAKVRETTRRFLDVCDKVDSAQSAQTTVEPVLFQITSSGHTRDDMSVHRKHNLRAESLSMETRGRCSQKADQRSTCSSRKRAQSEPSKNSILVTGARLRAKGGGNTSQVSVVALEEPQAEMHPRCPTQGESTQNTRSKNHKHALPKSTAKSGTRPPCTRSTDAQSNLPQRTPPKPKHVLVCNTPSTSASGSSVNSSVVLSPGEGDPSVDFGPPHEQDAATPSEARRPPRPKMVTDMERRAAERQRVREERREKNQRREEELLAHQRELEEAAQKAAEEKHREEVRERRDRELAEQQRRAEQLNRIEQHRQHMRDARGFWIFRRLVDVWCAFRRLTIEATHKQIQAYLFHATVQTRFTLAAWGRVAAHGRMLRQACDRALERQAERFFLKHAFDTILSSLKDMAALQVEEGIAGRRVLSRSCVSRCCASWLQIAALHASQKRDTALRQFNIWMKRRFFVLWRAGVAQSKTDVALENHKKLLQEKVSLWLQELDADPGQLCTGANLECQSLRVV